MEGAEATRHRAVVPVVAILVVVILVVVILVEAILVVVTRAVVIQLATLANPVNPSPLVA